MQIRKIEKTELDQLYSLSENELNEESWTKNQLKEIFTDENYIILGAYEDELVSFVIANKSVDDINILLVATNKKYSRQGYATALIEAIFEMAKQENISVSLEVSENNSPAIKLYKKLGFIVVSIRNNYYKDKSNAIIMFH